MERGTRGEYEAVRERWAALERRRARTTRLLVGFTLLGVGALTLAAAFVSEACGGGSGYAWSCTTVTPPFAEVGLLLVGVFLSGVGAWLCLSGR
jgi:hypothetical protein